jgi:Xaa-Pro aminopeptidase
VRPSGRGRPAASGVEPEEHRQRQVRAREAAAARGLAALVAFSRCGGTHDRLAHALWLAGLATSQPFVADLPGHWRAAGHVAVVVPADGPVTAVVESEELRPAAVADEIVVAEDLIAATADALAGALRGRERARVGVLGADVVAFAWWAALEELLRSSCPGAALEAADDMGMALRRTKSSAEQRLLRAAGRLGARAMAEALDAAVPGASEAEVAATLIQRVVREGGAVYDVAVSSGAASVTLGPHGGAAGAAGWTGRRLAAGDLLRIDAYGSVGGYLFDFARSVVVGDAASDEQVELIAAMRASVMAGIEALRPGVALSEVALACEDALAASDHGRRRGVPKHLMGGFWGHGLGLAFESPWIGPESTELVEPGWCLAIERRAAVPGLGGAQYEDDVLVGPDGAEVLTIADPPDPRQSRDQPV